MCKYKSYDRVHYDNINTPVHDVLLLITSASSKGSGEFVYLHNFTRAFAAHIHIELTYIKT